MYRSYILTCAPFILNLKNGGKKEERKRERERERERENRKERGREGGREGGKKERGREGRKRRRERERKERGKKEGGREEREERKGGEKIGLFAGYHAVLIETFHTKSQSLMHAACHLKKVCHILLGCAHQYTVTQVHNMSAALCCLDSLNDALLYKVLGAEEAPGVHVAL